MAAGLLLSALSLPELLIADDSAGSIDGIYRGAIGRQQIVLEISRTFAGGGGTDYDDPDNRPTYPIGGDYFYRRHGVSISLAGTPLADGRVRLREYRHIVPLPFEFTAEWRVRFSGDRAVGVFCKCDLNDSAKPAGPLLKITLRRVSKTLTPADSWQGYKPHTDYTYYDLLLDFPVKEGPEVEVSRAIAYRMRTDTRFGVSRPELTRLPDAPIMARINNGLDAEFTESRLWASAVLAGGQFSVVTGGFYDGTAEVSVFPPDVLAVLVRFSYYSGGAHTNGGNYARNYNLQTGERFTLEDSFRAGGEAPAAVNAATLLERLYRRHYVKPPSNVLGGIDCDIVFRQNTAEPQNLIDAFAPGHSTLFMSREGLMVIPTFFSYADDDCAPPVTVAYRELRPYVKRDSLLRWVVDRAKH
jgi:hypothetical protein